MAKRAYKIQLLDKTSDLSNPKLRIVYDTVTKIALQE
jgi:hypothetical protein